MKIKDESVGEAAVNYLTDHIQELFDTLPVETVAFEFTKERYQQSYEEYMEKNRHIFEKIYELFDNSDRCEINFARLIYEPMRRIRQSIKAEKFFQRSKVNFSYNQCLTVYLLPALVDNDKEYNQIITDIVIEKWHDTTKNNVKAASFEEINESFNSMMFGIPRKK